jgi:hypothetical protein
MGEVSDRYLVKQEAGTLAAMAFLQAAKAFHASRG